jgi:hypothetical protein
MPCRQPDDEKVASAIAKERSMARELKEHFPLCGWDEYPIHQSNEPLRLVATTDPRAFERYWFTAADDTGEFYLVTGMGFYPNMGTADAYAILVHDNKHTAVRAHRGLGQDRAIMTVGPLRAELIEPFTEWRLTLDENPMGLRFDLRWRDSKRAMFQRINVPAVPNVVDLRLISDWAGYESFGTVEGQVEYQGKKFKLDPARFRGSRDHHWGTRNGVGGHILAEPPNMSHIGQWVEFEDWSIWANRVL